MYTRQVLSSTSVPTGYSVILYPVGTDVELSTGELARVVANNPQYVLRPKVVGIQSGKTYDLADIKNASIVIK